MNPHEMRELFNDALAGPAPARRASTDDIVASGKRSHRRRRAAQTGAGALAAVAALALVVTAPMVLGRGGDAGPPASGESGEESPCSEPSEEMTAEQAAVATMYDHELREHVAGIGGSVGGSCGQGEADHDDFYYDAELGGYRFEGIATFPDTDERVSLTVDVLDPAGDPMVRAEELAGCESIDGTCTWDGGLLMVEEQRTVLVDEDVPSSEERLPYHSALLLHGDGTVVHVQMGVAGGPGTLSTTPEQLGQLAAAIPVGEEAPEAEQSEEESTPAEEELIGAFTDAIASELPGAVVDAEASIAFADVEEGSHYGEDDTAVAVVEAVIDGQPVTLFLQKTPIDAPGDGGAGQTAAEHYSKCDDAADCQFIEVDESTSRVHRTVEDAGTELTSVEFRAGSGWVLGVGVKAAEGTPPVDFETLDAMVALIG
ncbi:hypothetical protein [Glycomyces tenuis]|uniref:hypothetical protein n=1 Tax=Glycomyces tenuis TaxID=58116 RepID=UPI00042760E8|nr:hypothetical protein [Glycomyces tenuis]